ncbi:MAG: uridine kinase [Candidatus Izemoplasmatales bacterium]|jgi:uridine kinase|nr:uridine kinase [Candidatus Izemoplasmatales bacterium]MDD4354272.1 uridine kinase [Candidatus Izemoplasmatales bacterium]MDY0373188.1 uridine kinase [Candidatus Izemoplasmatales bacterium]
MKKPVIIAVGGGSSSGKTTVVNKILSNLGDYPIVVIKHDDYYKDQSDLTMEERRKVNYDHPFALDNNLFYSQLQQLISGHPIDKPTYDFIHLTRAQTTERIHPAKIIFLEGILVLEDVRIRDLADIKIFVEADDDLRFIRRLLRDTKERGRTLESVIDQYLTTVKPMHYAFVKPTKRYADIIIPNDISHDVAVDLIKAKILSILN